MEFHMPNPSQLAYGLRALKTLALSDGELAVEERSVIAAAQQAFGSDAPIDSIDTILPSELAAGVEDPAIRRQLFGAMVVLAMADGEVNRQEAAMVAEFASELEIADSAVENLKRISEGHVRRARLDILRRQWAPRKIKEMADRDGVGVYYRAVVGLLGLRDDPAVIMRYQALGEHPPGSLGRGYFDYMIKNDFSFPGAKGAPPEAMLFHDLTHVLSGYGTRPEEEILVATFSAGYSSTEVANWLVFVLSQFQLGLQMAPNVPPERLKLQPPRLIAAFRRGAAMNIDINQGWDPWPVLGEQVEDLRIRYNILPESNFLPSEQAP